MKIILSKSYIAVMLYEVTKKVNRKTPCDRKNITWGKRYLFKRNY